MIVITATEMQRNLGKYLKEVENGEEILILENGKEVARLLPSKQAHTPLTDSLVGVLRSDYDEKEIRQEMISRREIR